jgi:glycosylphosphatidylinositol transamidase (GPIT) subunit GPI8
MKYDDKTLNIRRLQLEKEPYFIYFTGHGGDKYFKIR